MGHANVSRAYRNLQKRLDRSPQGAPESEALFRILKELFSEQEARLVSRLPFRYFTVETAAETWKKPHSEAEAILDTLADKGLMLDFKAGEERKFILAPTMAGFFEFSLMRTDGRFDARLLSELYHQYINVEPDFVHILHINPPIDRAFVHEDQIPEESFSEVLDYERVSHVIDSSSCISVGRCYCRHKMEHLGKACDNPQDVCLTFNGTARSLIDHDIAREISKEEAHEIIRRVEELGLVHIGDNVRNEVAWICNCCSCCCEALLAYKRLGYVRNIHTNFEAAINPSLCINCGKCAQKCPVDAIHEGKDDAGERAFLVNLDRCIGCGVCSCFCPTGAIRMERRAELNDTPKDGFERMIRSAIDTGKLGNLIFDNYHLWTHRILSRFINVLLGLGPIHKQMMQKQVQSRFLRFAEKKAAKTE
ncbi:MAG TPA: (Fe-S)-binding protein [Candidatus Aminicenantes bacterium]|nr:(Fe-S)-binding protein [Candidatus Aminicenantes bacterium]